MEKKILITMNDDMSIEAQGFDNESSAFFEVIGMLRLAEAQLIESITGTLIKNSEIRES